MKVLFVFRGLDLTMKAGFERGSSSGPPSRAQGLRPPSEQGLLSGQESMALIYASVLAFISIVSFISQGPFLQLWNEKLGCHRGIKGLREQQIL